MPHKGAKYSSDYLPKEQMHAALLALSGAFLKLLGEQRIIATYGLDTNIHNDLQYKPMRDHTLLLHELIENSIEQRIVIPGESDFRLEVPEGRLEITFCHESDIHLDGSDEDLLQRFMATEPFSRLHWNTREEVEKSFK